MFGNNDGQGVVRGWYWRFDLMTVVILAVLEIIAFYVSHGGYNFITSGELAMFVSAIIVVQRAKVRRTANTLVTVIALLVLNLIFQFTLAYPETIHYGWGNWFTQNGIIALIGILFSIVYSKTTSWSDKRRKEADEKRRAMKASDNQEEEHVPQRVHRVKKKRGRGKRT